MASPRAGSATRQRLLDVGMAMFLEHGYHGLGTQALLEAAHAPKGSFYHHFRDKHDFALQVIDEYMRQVHAGLDHCLDDRTRPPLLRVRAFFELTQRSYAEDGYLGCLMGNLGQELSGTDEAFRAKIESCFAYLASRIEGSLEEARGVGDLPSDTDAGAMAALLVDCWEGAALRSRLRGSPEPLTAMLDFYFGRAIGS
jgi:TetR/AcrR family transcriptional repressor of nem operon